MEKKENRRRSRRHPAQWKIALVLDKSDGKPIIVHSQTVDLSLGGASVVSADGDLVGNLVTVLLAQPPRPRDETTRIMKGRAQVVSAAKAAPQPGYRLGLKFVQWSDEGLESLVEFLKPLEAGRPETVPHIAATAPPSDTPTLSRLAKLKEIAQAKLSEKERPSRQEEINERISEALARAHQYLKEFTEQLNVVQPAYKGYTIVGAPAFSGLAWETGRADFHTRELAPAKRLYERVTLGFRLSGRKQINIALESPASDRLKRLLTENKIEFTTQEVRSERGQPGRTAFTFPCEVAASALLEGKFETGRILLRMSNVGHFGTVEHQLAPEAITEEALEEFAGFVLGEKPAFTLLLRS